MGRSRYHYYTNYSGPYFCTATCIKWLPLFGFPEIAQIVIDSLQFLIREQRIELHGFVIMVNHLHLIATGDDLSREIGLFKSYTARRIVDWLTSHHYSGILRDIRFYKKRHKKDQEYQVWEEGSYPKLITNVTMLRQKLNYLHNNPVKKNYVDDPAHWLYSSYRAYSGDECVLPVTPLR